MLDHLKVDEWGERQQLLDVFLASHPDFHVEEVDWQAELASTGSGPEYLRVVCVSDTHEMAEEMTEPVPDGDLLIHAGDFTNNGQREAVEKFNLWLGSLPHK